jgi:hypothetical protein
VGSSRLLPDRCGDGGGLHEDTCSSELEHIRLGVHARTDIRGASRWLTQMEYEGRGVYTCGFVVVVSFVGGARWQLAKLADRTIESWSRWID